MPRIFVLLLLCALGACDRVHEQTLDNGLRVIVQEDHRSPVVTSQIWYRVGSIDEPDGLGGISHVLEHMMFKGTERLKPNEFSRIIAEQGGRENAFTSTDYTAYHQQLERSRLEIAFELEADRMRNLRLAPEEFTKELKVVLEERRWRTDDRPEGLLWEKFMATAYQTHSYRNPIIGWRADLERLTVEGARSWYDRYYAPNNAVLVVAGDVQPRAVFELARRHFGALPRREIKASEIPPEPVQQEERRVRVRVPAEVPMLYMGYHVPVLTREDSWEPYALSVAAAVLDGGDAARFASELVREWRIAASAGAGYSPIGRAPSLFVLDGTPATGSTIEALERALRAQVKRLRDEPVTAEELQRVKAQVVASDVYARDSVFYQGMRLGQLATFGLDLKLPERYPDRIRAVTAEQVQAVAQRYLVDTNLTVAILDPLPMKAGARPAPRLGGVHVR